MFYPDSSLAGDSFIRCHCYAAAVTNVASSCTKLTQQDARDDLCGACSSDSSLGRTIFPGCYRCSSRSATALGPQAETSSGPTPGNFSTAATPPHRPGFGTTVEQCLASILFG